MTSNGILQLALFFGLVLLLTKPMGAYMARVFQGERTFLTPVLRPVERLFYRLFGVREDEDMKWTTYAFALLMFSVVGGLLTYALLRLQGHLPFNPQHFTGKEMTPDLAFNTAMSFTTNTNWQNYVPEAVRQLLLQHGGAGLAQLDVGGDGHRGRHRPGARLRPPLGARASATSGST